MMTVIKRDNVKTTPIDVKMDISLFEIRCDSFQDLHFWLHFFNSALSRIAKASAMTIG